MSAPPHPDPLYLIVTRRAGKFEYSKSSYIPNARGPDRPQGEFVKSHLVVPADQGLNLDALAAKYHHVAPLPKIVSQIPERPKEESKQVERPALPTKAMREAGAKIIAEGIESVGASVMTIEQLASMVWRVMNETGAANG